MHDCLSLDFLIRMAEAARPPRVRFLSPSAHFCCHKFNKICCSCWSQPPVDETIDENGFALAVDVAERGRRRRPGCPQNAQK